MSSEDSENEFFVKGFLSEINCEQYLETFKEYGLVDENNLQYIDREILDELCIEKIGDKLKILSHSRKLRSKVSGFDAKKELNDITVKINSLNHNNPLVFNEDLVTDNHSVIFILNDGSAKKVNVNGCFNAHSIKKKLIKRLPMEFVSVNVSTNEPNYSSQAYDVFVVDYSKNVLHLLYDVELVTICHSSDRLEKNRLIFVSRDQTPSEKAIFTSKKVYIKTLSVMQQMESQISMQSRNSKLLSGAANNLRIENREDELHEIFNQRPPSELISTNLPKYFPHTDLNSLKKTLRNSMRQSIRASRINGKNGMFVPNLNSNKIGDILVNSSHAVDRMLFESVTTAPYTRSKSLSKGVNSAGFTSSPKNDLVDVSNMSRHSQDNIKSSSTSHGCSVEKDTEDQNSRIELFNTDSESDNDHYDYDDADDTVSLPTKVEAPKSWLKGARIGSGSFGSVYLGMNAQTGELMAVKQVELQPTAVTAGVIQVSDNANKTQSPGGNTAIKNTSQIHKKMVDALQHEMNILKDLHHENIVTYYGSSQEGGNLNIFLEYVPGGSVSSMLSSYGPFEEPLIKSFTRQILLGLAYLHKKNIIHRDIKGANILIDIKGGVKITDFGISKKFSPLNVQQNKRASLQGSVYWMAPEVVKQVVTTEKADIWSVGCVVVEMFTGKHPFPDFSQMQAIFKIGTNTIPELPSWASTEARDFLIETFELDYRKRPSSLELLQNNWLSGIL